MNRHALILLGAICASPASAIAPLLDLATPVEWEAEGGYRIARHQRSDGKALAGQTLDIRFAGRLVDHFDGDQVSLVTPLGGDAMQSPALPTVSLTGPGSRDLIVRTEGTEGRNERITYDIVALDPGYARLAHASSRRGLPFHLTPVKPDGRMEIGYQTSVFQDYWIAGGPHPWIALAFSGNAYHLDPERTKALNDSTVADAGEVPEGAAVLDEAARLAYRGDSRGASDILSREWPRIAPGSALSLFADSGAMVDDFWCRIAAGDNGPEILRAGRMEVPVGCSNGASPYERWMAAQREASASAGQKPEPRPRRIEPLDPSHLMWRILEIGAAVIAAIGIPQILFGLWLNYRFRQRNRKVARNRAATRRDKA